MSAHHASKNDHPERRDFERPGDVEKSTDGEVRFPADFAYLASAHWPTE